MKENTIICGDNLEVMAGLPDNSIDTIITDPPYGLGFMGKDWDTSTPGLEIWVECLRIAKPGAMMLVFGGTRTYHRSTCAIEDAGWQIQDCMMWLYGSGFPKSHNISKAIDKAKGAKREVVCDNPNNRPNCKGKQMSTMVAPITVQPITAPATNLAKCWDGYGTALKPAWEPIVVAMKPLDGTFPHNAEEWGVGGLWIDGGRIGTETRYNQKAGNPTDRPTNAFGTIPNPNNYKGKKVQGRWPANLILDEESAAMLDEQSGILQSGAMKKAYEYTNTGFGLGKPTGATKQIHKSNSGGASRFFYCAKASRSERNAGLERMEEKITDDGREKKIDNGREKKIDNAYLRGKTLRQNNHPTVKPLKLMEYLCKLTKTPTGGIVLDPFGGSGTTAVACRNTGRDYILIEKDPHYCEIAKARAAIGTPALAEAEIGQEGLFE